MVDENLCMFEKNKNYIYDIFGIVILFGSQKKWATNKEQGDCDINVREKK